MEETPPIAFQARLHRAAESILENEALTANLEDEAAEVLLDWGVTLARRIVSETVEMEGPAADEATYQPMRALRKMLRQINNWAVSPDQPGLEEILEQAAITLGAGFDAPGAGERAYFGAQIAAGEHNPAERIRQLRHFIENPPATPSAGPSA